MNAKLRFALDMGPLLVFFLCYRFAGLMTATAALIVFTLVSLAITYVLEKRISPMPLVSGVAVAVFGGMTLWLHDELFIKMKPTLVNLLFAAILLGGVFCKKPMLKYVLESAVQMKEEGWLVLSRRWGLFFIFLAGLNEIIWRNFPTDFWVNFKVFGMFTLTMAFMLSQIPLMKKYGVEEIK
jgi:intracellular septation protein